MENLNNNFEDKLSDLYTPKLQADFNDVESAWTPEEARQNLQNIIDDFLHAFPDMLSGSKNYQRRNAVVAWMNEYNFLAKFNRAISDLENVGYDTSEYDRVYGDLLNFIDPDHEAETLYEIGTALQKGFPKREKPAA